MSWDEVSLTEVCDFQGGTQPPKSTFIYEPQPGYVRLIQIQDFKTDDKQVYIPDRGSLKKCQKTDVMLARYGASVGQILTGLEGAYNVALIKTLPDKGRLERDFLLHLLRGEQFQKFLSTVASRAAQAGFNKDDLARFRFFLPPLPEQKRIAAILDKADAIRRKREKAIELTDSFLRSVFLEMFGDLSSGTQKCPVVLLGDVCNRITDGTHQSPKWASSGVPFLFVSNVVKGQLTYSTDKFISEETFHTLTKRCPIETGDVLYTTVGSYGNAALVGTNTRFCFQRHIAHLKPNSEKINSRFLHVMLGTPSVRQQADSQARGVAQKTLNLSQLKEFKVLLPSMAEQQNFALIAEKVDSLVEKVNRSYSSLSSLSGSLQNELFQTKRCGTQGELHLTSLKEVAHAL